MKGSLLLGRVAGIKIYIHWTVLILILWIVQMHLSQKHELNEILEGILFIIVLMFCVTLHELGHALTAKCFHIRTKSINILPIGGVALLEGMPDKPLQEIVVAAMGPVVNLIIALLIYLSLWQSNALPQNLTMDQMQFDIQNFWLNLLPANLFLAIFNLVPTFPMDGGRIFRALLALKFNRLLATKIASYLGKFIAIAFVLLGFIGNPMLIFVGLFVYLGANSEIAAEETKFVLAKLKVSDVLMHKFSTFHPEDSLSKAVHLMLDSQEKSFIVVEGEDVKGVISSKEIIDGLPEGEDIPVSKVMEKEFLRLQVNDLLQGIFSKLSNNKHALSPVYDGDKFVGVLNVENINEYLLIKAAHGDFR